MSRDIPRRVQKFTKVNSPSPYDPDFDLDLPPLRRKGLVRFVPGWLALGFGVSLAVHVGLVAAAQKVSLTAITEAFQTEPVEKIEPLTVSAVDTTFLEDEPLPPEPEPVKRPDPVQHIPEIKPDIAEPAEVPVENAMRDMRMTPGAQKLPDDIFQQLDQPTNLEARTNVDQLRKAAGNSGEEAISNMEDQFLKGDDQGLSELAASKIAEDLRKGMASAGRGSGPGDPRGFSDIDQLLRQTGPIVDGTPPIMMDSDVLFASDKSDLQPNAVSSLQKLGLLLQKHPEVIFIVEGHTDSFGPDAYNMALSQRRAESVKIWLEAQMGISPNRIQARGYGKTRLMAPGTGTVDEQQLNRRVEILIQTPEKLRR